MREQEIRKFPQEVPGGAWPLLQPTLEDTQYQPAPRPAAIQAQQEISEPFYLSILNILLKGTIIGLLCFGVFFGIIQDLSFWLQGWHWAIAIIGTVVLGILIGVNRTLITLTLVAVVFELITMIINPLLIPLLLLFIIGGVFVRGILELLL